MVDIEFNEGFMVALFRKKCVVKVWITGRSKYTKLVKLWRQKFSSSAEMSGDGKN